jgi:beta-glucosidase
MSHHPRTSQRRALLATLTTGLSLSVALLTVQTGAQAATQPATQAATGATPTRATAAAKPRPKPYENASLPTARRVRDLLSRMTLTEKIGQMTQAERDDVAADPTAIKTLNLGSVLSGGGSVPASNTPTGWANMVDDYQDQALATRLHIPIIYGVDSVHGHGNLQGATVFPHNIGLGATRDPRLVRKIADITAQETRASGPQWAFAPCICVARDDRWGRTYESYGENPKLVEKMETSIDGLQGGNGKKIDRFHVLATAKHFAGDGLTTYGTGSGDYPIDQGVDQVSRPTFDKLALAPYWPAVMKHNVGSVMPSFSSVDWTEDGLGNPVKMSANRELITNVLKKSMSFHGFVISDWQAIHQLPGTALEQVVTSVNAGIDMFMEPDNATTPAAAKTFEDNLLQAVNTGQVKMTRIDDAVKRILTAKFKLGLFEHPYTDRSRINQVGSAAHHKVARTAVHESQVLLKNSHGTLPLKRSEKVYVAGSNADNIGNQSGGWTLTWQGGSTNVIPGQTILDGIKARAGQVTFSQDASAPVPAGANGIVVVGETPYAEGFGDVGGPQWGYDPGDNGVLRQKQTMQLNDADKAAVQKVCAAAATCTVVVVSGRPMVIEPALLAQIDALDAAWLPGSEGAGVADNLFGRAPFTGKLSVSWPRSVAQEPINVGDAGYDPLYRYGFGLRTR